MWGIKRQIFAHPCVSLADLVLSKLQIHEVTANDLIDLTVLLGEQRIGAHDAGQLDLDRMLDVLCDDWGFWYSADQNLALLHQSADRPGLDADVAATVRARIETLRAQLAAAPKSRRWRLRARIGTRKRWYEPVEEVG